MSKLRDLINPPTPDMSKDDLYKFMTTLYDYMDGVTSLANNSQTLNPNFAALGSSGMTPITQADGDNAQFMQNWNVVGATQATYTLTPTQYPNNSTVNSSSPFFVNTNVSTYSGTGLYFYQRQSNSVRKYQQQYITLTISVNNNQSEVIRLRFQIDSNYGSSSDLVQGGALYLQPGMNDISTTVLTSSLSSETVTSGNYTEFRLYFDELNAGTANIDLYMLKAEFGKISTPLGS